MATSTHTSLILRQLPAVDKILRWPALSELLRLYGRETLRVQVRGVLETFRVRINDGELIEVPSEEELVDQIAWAVEVATGGRIRRVLNATGIFLHTNLGRAPLPTEVLAQVAEGASAGCNLELDLATGNRGNRNYRAGRLLGQVTGCQDAIVVNNNAAALVLVLATLAQGREVILSRGEMVEIGGSFRVPEILEAAGARLVEVGTTNRTRLDDYRNAISSQTALLLKVHPSNYRVRGFTRSTSVEELAGLGRELDLPLVVDEGAGLLRARSEAPFSDHESVQELLEMGASIVCSSGDKVLGGPQAGLLMGESRLITRCYRHPLYRAFRPGRLIYSALEESIRRRLAGVASLLDRLWVDPREHTLRLERARQVLPEAELVEVEGFVGGGAAPDAPVLGLALALPSRDGLLQALRLGEPAVVAYVQKGRMILDLRTVDPADDPLLLASVRRAIDI